MVTNGSAFLFFAFSNRVSYVFLCSLPALGDRDPLLIGESFTP